MAFSYTNCYGTLQTIKCVTVFGKFPVSVVKDEARIIPLLLVIIKEGGAILWLYQGLGTILVRDISYSAILLRIYSVLINACG